MKISYLDGTRFRRSLLAACEYAQKQQGELNRINVFPVPDGDTGTNLAMTVRAIADHLRGNSDRSLSAVAREAAQAAVMGARGNCGMMLSHFLLGFADDVRDSRRVDPKRFGRALMAGVENLHRSLERPVEGTILTVMRDTATAATSCTLGDFAPLVAHLVQEARSSLDRTPQLLPVLAEMGVVDAGAKGFVSLLDGVHLYMEEGGDAVARSPESERGEEDVLSAAARVEYPQAAETFRYCTEALVRGEALPDQATVRGVLRDWGDSLIVIRSEDVLKIHVHTDDPDRVFAYLRGVGRLVTHKAEDMEVQHRAVSRSAQGHVTLARRPVVVVTDSAADLPEEVVRAHGIHVVPLVMVHGDRSFKDGIDIKAEDFHRILAEDAPLPTTSQPSPADFLATFGRASEEGEAIVAVILGSGLSGTVRSAAAAATRVDGSAVSLVDSQGASLLTGLLALKACELAESGRTPSEIVEELTEIRSRSGIVFTVDTFDRLVASGRVSTRKAILGSLIALKPILRLDEAGRVVPVRKAMGRARARRALFGYLDESIPEGSRVRFGVIHVGVPEVAVDVAAELRSLYGDDVEILISPATPVISTHLGIGAWGVAYMVED
ncbi:MAG: DegV family EDD domain-containing protein [Gemmatimonadota bacterium]|nr:DegV family EDD domain-containing protein [Gemmatimonadota bacterium]